MENVHGTALLIGDSGILIRGPAQSGKSSLCLSLLRRCEALKIKAFLVSDDRVDLERSGAQIIMSAPTVLKGLFEIAGVGIVRESTVDTARLSLIVDIVAAKDLIRMPDETMQTVDLSGIAIRRITTVERDAAFAADVVLTLLKTANLSTT